jgi:hypothetical protein
MLNAAWMTSLEPLKTRREVRGFLARTVADLVVDQPQRNPSIELSDLATGSDREVIESYRRLDRFCDGLKTRDARYGGIVVTLNLRDLFANGLSRMKELPPDPREPLHVLPAGAPDLAATGQK